MAIETKVAKKFHQLNKVEGDEKTHKNYQHDDVSCNIHNIKEST
jgi:hypothetical protein